MHGLPVLDWSFGKDRRDLANLPHPTRGLLLAPVLHVMGEQSEYRPLVPIEVKIGLRRSPKNADAARIAASHDPFGDEVLRAAGFDPFGDDLPFPLWSNDSPTGMYKRIYYAHRDFSRGYCQTKGGKKRVSKDTKTRGKGKGKKHPPLFVRLPQSNKKTAYWALTEAGVALAARARTHFQTNHRNVTACWLDGQFNHADLFDRMHRTLLVDPRMARERASGEVLDHLQGFFLVSIKRDAFASRLGNGEPPTFRQLVDWCVRKAISQFRKFAQEPLTRESRGALTKRERDLGCRGTESMAASPFQVVALTEDEEGSQSHCIRKGTGNAPLTDVVDPTAVDRMEHRIAWNQGIDRVREAIRRHKPGNPDRYAGIFDSMCDGISQKALAAKEGVSKNRAATLMADTRIALKAARQSGIQIRMILDYIREEPWSTLDDLQKELDGDMPLALILVEQVKAGRLTTMNGSFCITAKGESYLEEWGSPGGFDNTFSVQLSH